MTVQSKAPFFHIYQALIILISMRSFLKIDLKQLEKNYLVYKSLLPGVKGVTAVVKANAYGLGAVEISRTLNGVGCKSFAVATVEEGVDLRSAGIAGDILVLGYTPPSEEGTLLKYDLTQSLVSFEHALSFSAKELKVQIALNTGMNRFGMNAKTIAECERLIREIYKKHRLTGLYTHLSCADDEAERGFTHKQIEKFKAVCERVSDLDLEYIHCQNSAAGLIKGAYGNAVRLGIMLYGLMPCRGFILPKGIKPCFQWLSEVALVREVKCGERIGYGKNFIAGNDMKIAVVSTGYADGLDQRLSGSFVYIHGKPAKIIGRICMDVFFAEVSGIEGVKAGDMVEIIGENNTVEKIGERLLSSDYEVVTRIGARVARTYI